MEKYEKIAKLLMKYIITNFEAQSIEGNTNPEIEDMKNVGILILDHTDEIIKGDMSVEDASTISELMGYEGLLQHDEENQKLTVAIRKGNQVITITNSYGENNVLS